MRALVDEQAHGPAKVTDCGQEAADRHAKEGDAHLGPEELLANLVRSADGRHSAAARDRREAGGLHGGDDDGGDDGGVDAGGSGQAGDETQDERHDDGTLGKEAEHATHDGDGREHERGGHAVGDKGAGSVGDAHRAADGNQGAHTSDHGEQAPGNLVHQDVLDVGHLHDDADQGAEQAQDADVEVTGDPLGHRARSKRIDDVGDDGHHNHDEDDDEHLLLKRVVALGLCHRGDLLGLMGLGDEVGKEQHRDVDGELADVGAPNCAIAIGQTRNVGGEAEEQDARGPGHSATNDRAKVDGHRGNQRVEASFSGEGKSQRGHDKRGGFNAGAQD